MLGVSESQRKPAAAKSAAFQVVGPPAVSDLKGIYRTFAATLPKIGIKSLFYFVFKCLKVYSPGTKMLFSLLLGFIR